MINIKFETFISYYTSSFILAIVSEHKVYTKPENTY